MLVRDKIRSQESRDERRCSSARLLNLHTAIYSTTHRRPPSDHDSIVPSPLKRNRHRRDTRREASTKIYRRKSAVRFPAGSRILRVFSVARVSANRAERATIISGQSARKSSRRTSTAPPLRANFSYGQKAPGIGDQ